ncbi:MAG: YkvA family protein [Caloramator sp.]|nr:YkvA family protein [Caloramator sp.]
MQKIKKWAENLLKQLELLYKIYTYPKTPWYAKISIGIVIAYALSPIDLIPDFIPVLGYLDDFLILPIGIYLSLKLVPDYIVEECREIEIDYSKFKGKKIISAVIILALWILLIYLLISKIFR